MPLAGAAGTSNLQLTLRELMLRRTSRGTPPKYPLAIPARTKIGRYEICSQIGAGGMGEVYLAHDTKLDRKVALKILPADVGGDDRVRRFVQEAKADSALNHQNILTIYEI